MTHRRQHIVSFLFTAIVLVPLLAIAFLQLAQAYIKSNREERLESEKLVQVVLPAKDVVWEEEGKELRIGGRMFDIASFLIADGNYYLTGVYDDDETKVAGSLLHLLLSNSGKNLLHLLFLLQCFTGCLYLIHLAVNHRCPTKYFTLHFPFLPRPSCLVLGPPPRG